VAKATTTMLRGRATRLALHQEDLLYQRDLHRNLVPPATALTVRPQQARRQAEVPREGLHRVMYRLHHILRRAQQAEMTGRRVAITAAAIGVAVVAPETPRDTAEIPLGMEATVATERLATQARTTRVATKAATAGPVTVAKTDTARISPAKVAAKVVEMTEEIVTGEAMTLGVVGTNVITGPIAALGECLFRRPFVPYLLLVWLEKIEPARSAKPSVCTTLDPQQD